MWWLYFYLDSVAAIKYKNVLHLSRHTECLQQNRKLQSSFMATFGKMI